MTAGLPAAALLTGSTRILVPRQTMPPLSPVRAVPLFHDIGFIEHPDLYPAQERITRTTRFAARARSSLAVSPFTARALRTAELADHATALPIGALHDIDWSPRHDDPYLLCVAAHEPHKNLARLVRAFGRTPRQVRLVICGREGKSTADLRAAASAAVEPHRIEIMSGLDDEAYARLLEGCWGYIQPSLYEGLCIPALDLAAAGAPICVGDAGNLGDVFAGTELLFDPYDTDSVESAIAQLIDDGPFRQYAANVGRSRSHKTDWVAVAHSAVEAMQ
jgi:glycosyltransferase involved in cell wall biosynthesis